MLKFNIPVMSELRYLIDELLKREVDIYLHGQLAQGTLLFVDIDWGVAERIHEKLMSSWSLIYAYFLSNEALARGEKDPLRAGADVATIVSKYTPRGVSPQEMQSNLDALVEQAEYLLQFPPSRLVYLGGASILQEDVDALMALISV